MKRKPRVEIYQEKSKQWRWHVIASNGRKISASTESYKSRCACERSIQITFEALFLVC